MSCGTLGVQEEHSHIDRHRYRGRWEMEELWLGDRQPESASLSAWGFERSCLP